MVAMRMWPRQAMGFLGFRYGLQPGRGQHYALDALSVAVSKTPVNWILDADIRGFFDAISHGLLIEFQEHRIGDKLVIRLAHKWLKAGVFEDGDWSVSEMGRRRAQWLRRCSPTSTCTTSSISGPTRGYVARRRAM